MVLATLDTTNVPVIRAKPLTPEAFAPYGGVISSKHQMQTMEVLSANYGTAKKLFKVTPVINNFANCPSGKPSSGNFNMFRCSPPNHLLTYNADGIKNNTKYHSTVLERHPFSTQTFLPMGRDKNAKAYIVIVAKNRPDGLPDINSLEAFVANGDQAVTYGPGTWHAPMVAIGETVDFGVFIHENGQAEEDCQETYFKPGFTIQFDNSDSIPSKL
ncbi:ureidoglycolate lyase [Trichomonascus vanleenenianus]|uniref:ureidoglycolate hydrolase n=1 Tax=Trichomonascus vanleenenianus TaxID=2268995 RepID=UPI003ECB1B48